MAQYTQTGVDAIQEFGIQTSNYAPEYGQAGTAVFNLTMKSGTNQIHGSAYDNKCTYSCSDYGKCRSISNS
jgi:hypothetical protein